MAGVSPTLSKMFEPNPEIQKILDTLPACPGVYLMKDERGQVVYVGKAINLRHRVRSYFHAPQAQGAKVWRLVERVRDIEFIVTETELEALVLECNLIKKHQPHFNVRLKDDKRYPYIKVTWQEPFPRVYSTRRMDNDGARYFGPFTAVWAVHETLDTLRKIFPYLTCAREITGRDTRACLYYDIGLCLAPCIGAVSQDEYRAMIDRLCKFLQGNSDEVIAALRAQLDQAVERLEFERAARYRDQLQALARITEHQTVVSPRLVDQDVIAFARDAGSACVQVFFVRGGKLLGREYFVLEGTEDEKTEQVLSAFVKQFYDEAAYVPPEILLPADIDEANIIEQWLNQQRGQKVILRVPRRGHGQELLALAEENARATLAALQAQWLADENKQMQAVAELQQALGLAEPPLRIECYDISHLQGTNAVGALVVFERGVAKKSDYRKFKINTVAGADDYASLQEVLRRRLHRWAKATAESSPSSPLPDHASRQTAWQRLPDVFIVDGGKGQVSAAYAVLREFHLEQIPLIGLAKGEEEIFIHGRAEPLRLPPTSEALKLLQRIRDEAHRFGVTYHRQQRRRVGLASQLDAIPGIGPRRRRALLARFGSLEAIRHASLEELLTVPGMTRAVAQKLKEQL